MPDLQITRPDGYDDARLAAWWEVYRAGLAHDLGRHATYWQLPEIAAMVRGEWTRNDYEMFAAEADGAVVGAAFSTYPLLDNLTSVDVEIAVPPEHRRQGVGTALLAAVEQAALERGRTTVTSLTAWRIEDTAGEEGSPGARFASRHGYAIGLGDVQRELALPADPAVVEELEAEAIAHAHGYEIRAWTGRVPEDLLAGYVELSSRLNTEAPLGEMEWENETTDLDAARELDRLHDACGRTPYRSVAVTPDGTVAAYSSLVLTEPDPDWVFQWGTLVDPAHRGHRLGLAVKVANLRLLQRDPRAAGRRLVTWNAGVNDHMIAINERLGFRATCTGGELIKKLG
ncbi:MAG TPA: GNAT family N-acetyltransferase [Nocardioides sp.]|nr:GNAT family N-acetyltransferase [Nocardioides sp.]